MKLKTHILGFCLTNFWLKMEKKKGFVPKQNETFQLLSDLKKSFNGSGLCFKIKFDFSKIAFSSKWLILF